MMQANSFSTARLLSVLSIVGMAALTCALSAASASAGEILYKCEGLEEKSPQTSIAVKMYQGYGGWFFREGDMENMYELSAETLDAFKDVNDALRHRGIHLILVPMLPRGIAGAQFIPNGGILSDMFYDPAFSAEQFRAMVQSLRDVGIDAVDITKIKDTKPDFDWSAYYLKRDIHWTPEGAQVVAKALAEKISGLAGDITDPIEFKTELTGKAAPIRFNMGKALNEICQEKIPTESVTGYSTKRNVDNLDALLTEGDTPGRELVHVVGTSFTDERMDFNFNGFLREALKHDLSGFSIAGGGLTQSIYGWTQNANGLAKKPEILVWEYSDLQSVLRSVDYVDEAIVPAIVGDCDGKLKLAEKTFDETDTVDLDLPALVGKASDHYLAYTFTNKALIGFQSSYSYANGPAKKVSFENPSRVSGLAKLYQALPGGTRNAPVHVRLEIEGAAKSAGSVKLCRYPERIFQNAATSN
ncbi:alginate O-acetyltransferase AlgX-related protein [Rhizobium mongolense]|uniref:AlgX/AlgJ SGNH hydrolase-like domain-containing protein n=2 Tax=Rhizobium mongolense TaxID=57676 RepID=A0ABR6IHE4_9HYPH|nr:hypothetical protein [Rhizobium mongolense]MBB4227088.1 hypothetical protein [Rhizobium mongolense]TVZ74260.1 acetyltransferase AlgX (SGNH hydrolase-like protein) [Rhizobium mongolense USDA 1844]